MIAEEIGALPVVDLVLHPTSINIVRAIAIAMTSTNTRGNLVVVANETEIVTIGDDREPLPISIATYQAKNSQLQHRV